jgi:hypothetical protein
VESEGHEEKYRAVIEGATPKMNRSACVKKRGSACCAEDEGGPFEVILQERASNSHELLQSKAVVVNVMEKA